MNTTERVAQFVFETRFEDIPSEVIVEAKKVLLDCISVTLGGSLEPAGKIIVGIIKTMGGFPEASVVGRAFKTSVLNAALANGVMAHALDYDEGGHPVIPLSRSVTVFPAVLSLGESIGVSGKDFLVGYIVGFEVISKISYGISAEDHYEWGWQTTGTICTLGAAAGGAKILNLNKDQVITAIGISSSGAGGLRINNGTMTKPLHAGNAARNGVLAVLLSKEGFTGTQQALEGRFGFCECFCGRRGYDVNKMTEKLGKTYEFLTPGVGIKRYPSCANSHQSLDALFHLIEHYKFSLNEIERVECGVSKNVIDQLSYVRPQTALEGKFSLHYCLAAALLDGKVGLEQFTDEKVRDPEVSEIMEKVSIYEHPEMTGQASKEKFSMVTVRLRDGRSFSKRVSLARGRPGNPLNYDEIVAKYRECAGRVLSAPHVDQVLKMVEQIEDLDHISELTRVLRSGILS